MFEKIVKMLNESPVKKVGKSEKKRLTNFERHVILAKRRKHCRKNVNGKTL